MQLSSFFYGLAQVDYEYNSYRKKILPMGINEIENSTKYALLVWRKLWQIWRYLSHSEKMHFCLSRLIFQEPYIIWSSFMVHMCKKIISPCMFFIFSKFWFSGSLVGKRAKKAQNDEKFWLSHSVSQEPYVIWLWFLVQCVKWWYLQQLAFFSKF